MDYINYYYDKLFGWGAPTDDGVNAYSTPRKIVAFGNVLIDRTVQLNSTELLARHNLEHGSKGELELETLSQIRKEATEGTKYFTNPGGSALNTVRILKGLGTEACFIGAIGADEDGELLRDMLKERGVEARLQTIENSHTGQCIALVYRDKPTLYANIGASSCLSVDYLRQATRDENTTILRPIERKKILYIEGFFVPARETVCEYIVTHFVRERRRLALNLSAPYIVEQNCTQIVKLAQSAFFLFGNRFEYEALRLKMQCATIEEMALKLLQNGATTKIIVITKGADGVQLISNYVEEHAQAGEVCFQSFNVPRVEQVVDVTGAGDAFVAGFLHAWLEKRSLSECVRIATDVAAKVVTQVGCNLP